MAALLLISFLILVFHYFLSLAKESWILLLISKYQLLASVTLSFLCFFFKICFLAFLALTSFPIFLFQTVLVYLSIHLGTKDCVNICGISWWAKPDVSVRQLSCYLNGKQSHYQTMVCLFKAQYILKTVFLKEYIYIYKQVFLDIASVKGLWQCK